MAIKHDMVAENQNTSGAQSKQNEAKLLLLLRVVRGAEPNTYEQCCDAIVKYLCQEDPPTPTTVKKFKEKLKAYRGHLNDLCCDAATSDRGQQLIQGCLKSLHREMVTGLNPPCVAAGIILDLFNSSNIPAAVRWMLTQGDNNTDEALTRVFETLTRWLCEINVVENIDVWVCEMLSGLYEERRYDLLYDLETSVLSKFMNLVKIPVFRSPILRVLQRTLVCDGRAPKVFHLMLPKLGDVIRSFNGQVHEEEILFLRTVQDMVNKHPDITGERYKEINHILNVFRRKLLEGASNATSLATPLVRLENNNPRVGLVNLGNTCYMNSVLQALVMTKHFSRELLLSYPTASSGATGGHLKSGLVFTIQKLLAQLLHSRRPELTPREVLHVTRPPSFLPGHQQDSSEFLSHLMDTLHEHELAVRRNKGAVAGQSLTPQRRKRPATQVTDQRQEELGDTGISVNSRRVELYDEEMEGEKEEEPLAKRTLIQRSFGGLLETTYHCLECGQKSTNRDAFRDVSLSFGMDTESKYHVQSLLDYYCMSEKLEGDNQYHCGKCAKLCDGVRSLSFVETAPRNLILTLKHFKYDQQFHTRAKLMHNVVLNETVTLKIHKGVRGDVAKSGKVSPVACSSPDGVGAAEGAVGGGSLGGASSVTEAGIRLAKYQLYAVVVHSGMSMDAGHYYTYASDEPDSWYMFNDSYVTKCSAGDVHRLRAPNTPYILFYRLVEQQPEDADAQQDEEDDMAAASVAEGGGGPCSASNSLPELEELPSYLKDFVVKDNFTYCQEMQKGGTTTTTTGTAGGFSYRGNNNNDSDSDDPPPPSSCGGNAIDSSNSYIC